MPEVNITTSARDELLRLMSLMTGDEKHGPSATSTLDVLWVLYDRVLNVAPDRTQDPRRDRFILSKGHGPMAYYAVLAAQGFLDKSVGGETLPCHARHDTDHASLQYSVSAIDPSR